MYDYLIVGQGLAGTILTERLLTLGKTCLVYDRANQPSSSQAAGGMFNPVTGKALTKTWWADELFSYLFAYYPALEKKLNASFFHPVPLFRPFVNEAQKDQFKRILGSEDLSDYLNEIETPHELTTQIHAPLGGLLTQKSGWVNVPALLQAWHLFLQQEGMIIDEAFVWNELAWNDQGLVYQGNSFKRVIACEGFYATQNPYFSWLPFNPVKGETLVVEVPNLTQDFIVNQGNWSIPLGGNRFRWGATYVWHRLDWESTSDGKDFIEKKVKSFYSGPFEVVEQQAGVRPTVKDRRPIVGPHPEKQGLYILNGLGTKGVSIGPKLIHDWVDHLEYGKEIPDDVTIQRFYSLY